MNYLYAVTEAHRPPLGALRGLDQAPLGYVSAGGLCAVTSEVAPPVCPTPTRLLEHQRVVETVMAEAPVLPARFATIFENDDALADLLEERRAVLAEELERLRGCVELSVRAVRLLTPAASAAATSGDGAGSLHAADRLDPAVAIARRAAAQQRAAALRHAEQVAGRLDGALGPYCLDQRVQLGDGAATVVQASYLVDRKRLPALQVALTRLAEEFRHLHFLNSGPWPPYHFAPSLARDA